MSQSRFLEAPFVRMLRMRSASLITKNFVFSLWQIQVSQKKFVNMKDRYLILNCVENFRSFLARLREKIPNLVFRSSYLSVPNVIFLQAPEFSKAKKLWKRLLFWSTYDENRNYCNHISKKEWVISSLK